MKNYIQFIPLTAFAAAIVLGGSLSAKETTSEGSSKTEKQDHNKMTDEAKSRPVTSSEFLGMNIDSKDNEKIGEINEILIDPNTGEVLAMVVSTGGLLGVDKKQSLISPKDLRFNAEHTLMQTDVTKDEIRTAPRYQKGETAAINQIHPLSSNITSDWENRQEHKAHAKMQPSSALVNKDSERQATSEKHSNRSLISTEHSNSALASKEHSNSALASKERANNSAKASTERTNSNEKSSKESSNQLEGVQSGSRGLEISELIGMNVENPQGEAIGKVDAVYIDLEKREVAGVVVSTGGFLGIGDRKTLFGMREMSFDSTNGKVLLDYNREEIREFAEFKPDEQSVFEDLRERINRLAPVASTRD